MYHALEKGRVNPLRCGYYVIYIVFPVEKQLNGSAGNV